MSRFNDYTEALINAHMHQRCNEIYCYTNSIEISCSTYRPRMEEKNPLMANFCVLPLMVDPLNLCEGCLSRHIECCRDKIVLELVITKQPLWKFFHLIDEHNLQITNKELEMIVQHINIDIIHKVIPFFENRIFPMKYVGLLTSKNIRAFAEKVQNKNELLMVWHQRIIKDRIAEIRLDFEDEVCNFYLCCYLSVDEVLRMGCDLIKFFCHRIPNNNAYQKLMTLKSLEYEGSEPPLSLGFRISPKIRKIFTNKIVDKRSLQNKKARLKKQEKSRLFKLGIPKKNYKWLDLCLHDIYVEDDHVDINSD